MSALKPVHTDHAPKAIGPYAQAVVTDGWVFCSGQIPLDPETMQQVEGDVAAQTEQVLTNLRHVLEAAGAAMDTVVKTTVFLSDMNDFARDERGLRPAFRNAPTRPRRRSGGRAAEGRGRRDRVRRAHKGVTSMETRNAEKVLRTGVRLRMMAPAGSRRMPRVGRHNASQTNQP